MKLRFTVLLIAIAAQGALLAGVATPPKGISAWLYANDAAWVSQLQYYDTQVQGKPAPSDTERRIKYLFPYACGVTLGVGGAYSYTYSGVSSAYHKAAFPGAMIMPNIDSADGANMNSWTVPQMQALADAVAADVLADVNAAGVHIDIEPFNAAHVPFYARLRSQLNAGGKYQTMFTGATSGTIYSNSDIVVYSGYDLGTANPAAYQTALDTNVGNALIAASGGGSKLLVGVPAAASTTEYVTAGSAGCVRPPSSGFSQEQWFASALNVLCARHSDAAFLGASIWAYTYTIYVSSLSCNFSPAFVSTQNIDGLLNINPPTCSGSYIPTASVTPTFTPTSSIPSTMIDDFSSPAQYNTNNLNDLVPAGYTDDDSTLALDTVSGGYLALNGMNGGYWYTGLADCYNATGYNAISFEVRGISGGETFNVNLVEKAAGFCGSGNNNKVNHVLPVTNYISVTTLWQTVVIPFSHFAVDPTRLFSFTLDGLATGENIQLDNLMFTIITGSPTPSVTPTPQLNGVWPVISSFNGDIVGNSGGGVNTVGNDNEDGCGASASSAGISRQTAGGHDGSAYLRLTYTVAVNAGCGYQYVALAFPLPFQNNISSFTSIRLWVRGGVGGEPLKLKIRSTSDACVPGKNSMNVLVPVSSAWVQVDLPFSLFSNQIGGCPYLPANATNVDFVELVVDTVSSGSIDIDDLEFVAVSPTPTPSYTRTPSYTLTPSPSLTSTPTLTFTESPTALGTYTETPTSSPTLTFSPSFTYSQTRTPSASPSLSPTFSFSPTRTLTYTVTATWSNTPPFSATLTRTTTPTITPTRTPGTPAAAPATLPPGAKPSLLAVPNPASPSLLNPMSIVFSNPENLAGLDSHVEIYTIGYTKVRQLPCSICAGPRLHFKWDGAGPGAGAAGTGYYYAVFKSENGGKAVATKFVILP